MVQKSLTVDTSSSPFAAHHPIPINQVRIKDGFWGPRIKQLRESTLPSQYEQMGETGRIDNFRRAAGLISGPYQGYVFNDSDVYKWLEAARWTLASEDFPPLTKLADSVVPLLLAAQQPDGYLNTYHILDRAAERWSNIADNHELYSCGHFIQAAIAHHRTTGKEDLLSSACSFADLVCLTFGPLSSQINKVPGHEEIEIALVELYRETGMDAYLKQAQWFLDQRGRGSIGGKPYHQDHKQFRQTKIMTGHAVRALYLNIAAADIYAETGDKTLLQTLVSLHGTLTATQTYITGGIGARHSGESLGSEYELPNHEAYAETCAAVASFMWNWRMFLITGNSSYADHMETVLYNAALAGISLQGKEYFYVNPLADNGAHRRQPWFECACCPPNIARLIASLPGYMYTTSEEGLSVLLYANSDSDVQIPGAGKFKISQETNYPWEHRIRFRVEGEGALPIRLRIPSWAETAVVRVGDEVLKTSVGGFITLTRDWSSLSTFDLSFYGHERGVYIDPHPKVTNNKGRAALQYGPLVYCFETVDNPKIDLDSVSVSGEQQRKLKLKPDLLPGVQAIEVPTEGGYPTTLTAIPYFAWANRSPGQMRVWMEKGR